MRLCVLSVTIGCLHVTAGTIPRPRSLVPKSAATDPCEGYAFAYFTGDSRAGENIYLATSNGNDALNWVELNGGQPILESTAGTKGLRDPFIIRSHDGSKFYLLATDLSIGSGTSWDSAVRKGSRYLEVWETADLVTWSAQRHVLVSPATAGNTWAPEAYYDDELGQYVVFWASSLYAESDANHTGTSYHRMMYATTSDFVTFSAARIWQDAGTSRIDSTVWEYNDVYYRFTKDEGAVTGCRDIIQESSSRLTDQLSSWKSISTCIGKNAGTAAVEGPTIFKSNPDDVHGSKFYLFVDEYTTRGYIPLETADISDPSWKVSSSFKLPRSPRHGTVLPITSAELSRIQSAYARKNAREVVRRDSPALAGYNADPNIAVFGDTYYIYPTTDGYPGWDGQTFYWWKSVSYVPSLHVIPEPLTFGDISLTIHIQADLATWTRSSKPFLTLNGTSGNVPWATGVR